MPTQQPGTRPADGRRPNAERLAGVDIARALAVFGMFTVHLGVGAIGLLGQDGAAEVFHGITRGNSSALFAFLAGLSLALVSGRAFPYRGVDAQRVRARVVVRAVLLIVLGAAVELLQTPVAVILVYYGLFFLLALPLLTLRAPALAVAAAAVSTLGPQASYLIREAWRLDEAVPGTASLAPGFTDLFLTGYYPAFTFMGFVLAGMAVGRLDLNATAIRLSLAMAGAGLVLLGYGGSWAALHLLGGLERLAAAQFGGAYTLADPAQRALLEESILEEAWSLYGEVPTLDPAWLLVATPHSGTTFEVLGSIGAGLLVLVVCLFLGERLFLPLYPLAAAGAMALTLYVGHLIVIAAIGASPWEAAPFRLELFVLGSLVFATLWRPLLGKGALERLLAGAAAAGEKAAVPPGRPGD